MKQRTNEQRKNTYNFLMDIYEMANEDYAQFSINTLLEKHKIARGTSSSLLKNKFLFRKNQGKASVYKWNSIRPNYKMVEKILDLNLEYNRMYTEARKNEEKSVDTTEKQITEEKATYTPIVFTPKIRKPKVVEVEKKQKSFSFFWGLIKINY